MPAEGFQSTSLKLATLQRLRAFKSLLFRRGMPEGLDETPTIASVSTALDVALEVATKALDGASVPYWPSGKPAAKKRKR